MCAAVINVLFRLNTVYDLARLYEKGQYDVNI